MVTIKVSLSDELARAAERLAAESQTSESEIVRRALTLYLMACDGKKNGLQIGLFKDGQLQTQIVGV